MKTRHIFLLIAMQAIWGANFSVVKYALSDWPPLFFVAIRLFGVGLLLTPFVGLPKRPQWPGLLLLTVLLSVIHYGSFYAGLARADAATTSIAVQAQLPISILLAAWLFGETIGWRRWAGMALAIGGIALLAGRPAFQGGWFAFTLIMIAAASWALSNLQIKRLSGEADGWQLSAWTGLIGAPMVLALSLLMETGQWNAVSHASATVWLAIAYQVFFITILSYAVWYGMVRRYPVNSVMPFMLLEPVFGATGAVLLLHEPWDWRMLLGGLVAVSGLAIIVFRRPQTVAQPIGPGV
jgi:O-acetylserine/cysteine efflux transporter